MLARARRTPRRVLCLRYAVCARASLSAACAPLVPPVCAQLGGGERGAAQEAPQNTPEHPRTETGGRRQKGAVHCSPEQGPPNAGQGMCHAGPHCGLQHNSQPPHATWVSPCIHPPPPHRLSASRLEPSCITARFPARLMSLPAVILPDDATCSMGRSPSCWPELERSVFPPTCMLL